MTSNVWLRVAMAAPFLVIFNTFFFLLGGSNHPASVWISYGFLHFSYVALLVVPRGFALPGRSFALFGHTIGVVAATYFAIELIAACIFIFSAPERFEAALLTQLALGGAFAGALGWVTAANVVTRDAELISRAETDYLKRARAEVGSLVSTICDNETRRKVERVADAISASPAKSHHSLAALEARILGAIGALRRLVASGNQCDALKLADELLQMIDERQRQLTLLN